MSDRRATAAELSELRDSLDYPCICGGGQSERLGATIEAIMTELAELRGSHGGWEPPPEWNVVSGDTEESWLVAREQYLTASDVATYIGVGPYATPKHRRELLQRKAAGGRLELGRPARLGQHLESGIINAAAEFTGRRFARVRSHTGASVLVAHPTIPRLAASLDGVELDGVGRAIAAVEAKCSSGFSPDKYYGWKSTRVQLQVQMACAQLPRGHIVVNMGTRQKEVLDIEPREDFYERLPDIVTRFWEDVEAVREGSEDGDE